MAMAVVKLNQKGDLSDGVSDTIQYFLDRLYINRSGLGSGLMDRPQSLLG